MKRIARIFLSLILIGIISWSVQFVYQKTSNPCGQTIKYSVGRFDTQFGITQNEFKNYLTDSETVWEKALERNVFVYDPNANFKINLVYDQRQIETVQKQKTEFGLSAVEETFRKLDANFSAFKIEYDQRVSDYEKTLSLFNQRKSDYENSVSEWNSKGGATKAQYEALEKEREYLNVEAKRLNLEASKINSMAERLNRLLEERNRAATEYNKIAGNYNEKYNQGLEFNQAEYVNSGGKEEINVYQFGNKKDLILALTHEFGHALGLGHVENSESVMYYLTVGNTQSTPILSEEDLSELKSVCKIR